MFELEKWIPGLGPQHAWIVQVFALVLATALVGFVVRRLLQKLGKKVQQTENRLDDIVFLAMSRPTGWIIWLQGLAIVSELIYAKTESTIFTYAGSVRDIGVLVCITWFVLGIIRGAEEAYIERAEQMDKTTAQALGKLLRLVVLVTAGLVIMQTLGYSISGVLAMGGVGGIAVGFAAKDLLANFFGGLIVYLDRPFAVGDWIRSPDRQFEGTVEIIGWRVTVIRNFQSQPIYVPNSVFTTVIVENPSRMENRRIYETIGLRYSDLTNMDKVVSEVESMLRQHEAIDADKTLMVNFNKFGGSSLDFFIYCFTRTTRWVEFHQVKQEVMLRIADIIEANHAEIAFPTTTIHLADPIVVEKP
ncbi:MAG: mechanosensitive ion channel family protein [Gammaproteobacteria bacterium]|nr:mechanosensitive ion channel family protein [Gammaproteobacteria bacterium]